MCVSERASMCEWISMEVGDICAECMCMMGNDEWRM